MQTARETRAERQHAHGQCGVPGASRRGELHESHVAWSGHSRKRSDHRARRLSLLPAGVGAHGISAVGPQDGGRPPYEAKAFSFSLSLSEGMWLSLRMISASVFTELDALSLLTIASSFGLSAAATVCCTSIRA